MIMQNVKFVLNDSTLSHYASYFFRSFKDYRGFNSRSCDDICSLNLVENVTVYFVKTIGNPTNVCIKC